MISQSATSIFFGDIYIKGNVMEGFSVKAGRSLKIEGTVFSATSPPAATSR